MRAHVAKTVRREDALDIEAFETMIASAPWAAFQARLSAELERARLTCEISRDHAEVAHAQGLVHALRVVAGLGPAMLHEMQQKTWRPPASNSRA